ncbi:pseudouridine synthase [Aerococcus urinaehominis]|uniref:tRNA pseudouridine synthase A n=1 Tax=Aerococcus urinaehominis TaxID=128944 RepID=A0A0X8FKS1_9LACT|nr:tRNA pseudouridine(38-40) synthase TruA [Aerococcus urinaehominis]AMB99120.1 pseudouridine synthase [Aerococcus urinaehominis]SDM04390.1 tRNA pseudouridine38-40 synthase [Aerococcus urinaehominis]
MRYKITLEYDGTDYVGFQIQPNGPSIQAELERALKLMTKGQEITVYGSGRTDSGVHALGQVIHIDYPAAIEPDSLLRALNSITSQAIRILEVLPVEDIFHARFHAKDKTYLYRVSLDHFMSPFKTRYALHHPYPTDISRIQEALQAIKGKHDFTSFCSTKTDKVNLVRTIYRAEASYQPVENEIHFIFQGDGFLYNMVRILVGTCLQIGDGLKPVDELERLLAVKDRNQAGPTAGAQGLFLQSVGYLSFEQRAAWTQAWLDGKIKDQNQSIRDEK